MNTGAQRSGTTPIGAITANTPFKGKLQQKKDVPAIMAAHKLSYVAACSAAYPLDLFDKIKNCMHLQAGAGSRIFPDTVAVQASYRRTNCGHSAKD
ncbi:MAG: hypothetical protein CVU70_02595 [Deltaproteobacteria bacterium HGW-Deltaproteobacteria-5]|nr:MAG: hypothetical protein CVU70_02595 [Deltaproteobacteria bacterium HGW-Deltaproteobacteria-5]